MRKTASVRRKLVKLILLATLPLVGANVVAVTFLGIQIWNTKLTDMEQATNLIHEFVDTSLRESIVSYLRAKVETAISMIGVSRSDASPGAPPDLKEIRKLLGAIEVAQSGYVYVISGDGAVVAHPDPQTQGRVIPEVEPVRTQLEMRDGYLQYSWQNSFERRPQAKAVYMQEYPPYEWIVSATSYRNEFVQLVDQKRIAATIVGADAGQGSYSTIVARDGTLIAHPDYIGRNMYEFFAPHEAARVMEALFSQAPGQLRYSWPSRTGEERRPKLMQYRYLPDFDWAIATTVYLDTLRTPIIRVTTFFAVFGVALVAVLINLALRMARTVTDPVSRLVAATEQAKAIPSDVGGTRTPRELAILIQQFNAFLVRLDQRRRQVADRENRLKESLNEKTVLIREIHHRVKNNLQVIASLLSLQSGTVHDPRDARLFEHSRERVISMALVHEQLLQADDLSLIPFDGYLRELIGHISHAGGRDDVAVTVNVDESVLEIYRAVPCGLIANELINNAMEHAFPAGRAGTITVTFRANQDQMELSVGDDGVGFEQPRDGSLGLTLVTMLAEQLDGTIVFESTAGTIARLRFPAQPLHLDP